MRMKTSQSGWRQVFLLGVPPGALVGVCPPENGVR